MKKNFDKSLNKKTPEELEQYLYFRRRGSSVASKKGKGSFRRRSKHKMNDYSQCV